MTNFSTLSDALTSVTDLINRLIPIVISIALLLFLIGIVQFVTAGGDEEKRAAARGMIIFGIIALFVMVSVWGFVNILSKTFFGSGGNLSNPDFIPHSIQQSSGAGSAK
jgi:hypothetical protein